MLHPIKQGLKLTVGEFFVNSRVVAMLHPIKQGLKHEVDAVDEVDEELLCYIQ